VSLVLFDIDGTLLLSGGAGVRAMTMAFDALFGLPDAFAGIPVAGHTDTFLISHALTRAQLPDTPEVHARFRDAYLPVLQQEIAKPGTGRRGVMPGVEVLLAALQHAPFHLALLTGNYEAAARIKLAHFGIDAHFEWGIFGEESADRNDLGRAAMVRARERGIPAPTRERTIIVGDTPHDIACAHAAGARSLAVATGSHSVEVLRAAGAEMVVADLQDTKAVVALLR